MSVVVDASVALKLVLNESDSELAESLIKSTSIVAPEFMLLECGNGLWAAAPRSLISAAQAISGLSRIATSPFEWTPTAPFVEPALAIAIELNRTIYDSHYLALAISRGSILVTADTKFAAAAEAHAVYRTFIRRLGAAP